GDNYALTGYARYQLNSFFENTERLPEIDLDLKRQPLFGGPIFYEGETSAAELNRNFPTGSIFEDYSVFRIDTFHQLTYPNTYFGWLAVVPRIGFRETYYSQTRDLGKTIFPTTPPDPLAPEFPLANPTIDPTLNPLF
ncbi:MAG: LPS assembly protein LptD, partial [Chthoniobacterales bacterium]|nr:LPS assembly protein LptD [Chthoniobacterales bacterium]